MSGARFPKRARLLNAQQYQGVLAQGRRFDDRHLVAIVIKNEVGYARLGLAISRKAASRAVDRNRLKRLIRESFRHHRARLANLDVVVIARHGAKSLDNASVAAILDQLWQRVSETCERC